MEVVGSEVHLWLSDEWIGVAFIEKIDIDTSMLRGDLTELRIMESDNSPRVHDSSVCEML